MRFSFEFIYIMTVSNVLFFNLKSNVFFECRDLHLVHVSLAILRCYLYAAREWKKRSDPKWNLNVSCWSCVSTWMDGDYGTFMAFFTNIFFKKKCMHWIYFDMQMRTFKAYREAVHPKMKITVIHIHVVSNSFILP